MCTLEMTRFERFLLDELWEAYLGARKGKRKTVDEHQFELNAMENILNLHQAILNRTYKPSKGVAFIVQDPVVREIVAAPFRDRVVHHFLYNTCAEWWDRRFVADSYSCRKGKGTLYGQRRLQGHMRKAMNESAEGKAFIVKLDLQGYFMSLQHKKLYEQILWGLERQFFDPSRPDSQNGIFCHHDDRLKLYKLLKYLWREIIFDEPMKGIRIRGRKSDWRKLPASKSLFCQPKGQGIVIGNLTSQLLSNIFMDQFDRHVIFDLGYRHYGRYVDDFYIIVPNERKKILLADIREMEEYLQRELSLTLHPKKRYYQDASKGVAFVGAMVFAQSKIPNKRTRSNYKRAIYHLATEGEGRIEDLVARTGSMRHLNSRKFLAKAFEELGWEYNHLFVK